MEIYSNIHLEPTILAGRFCLANWLVVGFISVELLDTADLALEFKLFPIVLLPNVSPRKMHKCNFQAE